MIGRILGSEKFGQRQADRYWFIHNKSHFILVTAKGTYLYIRTNTKTDAGADPKVNKIYPEGYILTQAAGREDTFRLLGYKIVSGDTWYYIEFMTEYFGGTQLELNDDGFLQQIPDNIRTFPPVPAGRRGWIREDGISHIAASYMVFLNDLDLMNSALDRNPNRYANLAAANIWTTPPPQHPALEPYTRTWEDNFRVRLGRLREMTHPSEPFNYDDALGLKYLGPYTNNLGEFETFTLNDPANTEETGIKPYIKLGHNYSHFYIVEGNTFYSYDFQHIMLVIDGLVPPNPRDVTISVLFWNYDINTADTIWAGDLSSASVEKYFNKKKYWKRRFLYAKRRDINNFFKTSDQIMDDYNLEVLKFYFDSGIPEKDKESDMLGYFFYFNHIKKHNPVTTDRKMVVQSIGKAVREMVANKRRTLRGGIFGFFKHKNIAPYGAIIFDNDYDTQLKTPTITFTQLWFKVRDPGWPDPAPMFVKDEAVFVLDKYFIPWLQMKIK